MAAYFSAYPQARAEQEVETHIRKFWEPRIGAQSIDYVARGADDLYLLVKKALAGPRNDAKQSV